MRGRWLAPLLLMGGLTACMDWFGPQAYTVRLNIVPVFDRADPYTALAASADQLRIRVLRADSTGAFTVTLKDTVVTVDSLGEASATLTLLLLQSPTVVRLILEATRSSDGVILFSGTADIQVTSAAGGTSVSTDTLNLPYVGPRAARIAMAPKDTAVATAATFTYRVTAFDTAGNALDTVPQFSFFLVSPGDSTKLTVGRLTGTVTALANATGIVLVYAEAAGLTSADTVRDTARVFLGAVPQGVRITPGYANLAVNDTLRLTGELVDLLGNPIAGSVSWASRNTSAATVGASGLVQGVSVGTAVIVATSSGFGDSIVVTVPTATHAVAYTVTSARNATGRSFLAATVGDTGVVVDVAVDMRFTPSEKLGSYNATLTWNPATLQYVGVVATTFAAPVVNADGAPAGTLRFSAADASGASGQVVVARVRFRAAAQGETTAALAISEMSAAQTFTNLSALNRVTVTSGHVTVRP